MTAVPAAEAVHVVNNNAAALALAATALAAGREIVLSRGEMVEIGDGFRIPDLLTSTGARLREVGTTNRTTLRDYAEALGPQTGFVLKVHPSNFVVTGFTAGVSVRELAALDAPLVVDIGSGLLAPDPSLPDEPDAATTLADGATLVTASGDKLLGGPQCGLLLGDRELRRAAASPPARPSHARRQADPRRAGSDPARTDPRRPRACCTRRRANCEARASSLLSRPHRVGHRRTGGAEPGHHRRRRRARTGAAEYGAEPAGGVRGGTPDPRPRRRRTDRTPDGSCSTCAASHPSWTRAARRDHPRRPAGLTCTSSRPPATSTTASPPCVRALTGMEPDRWAEERRRGMTIDLGFAWTTLRIGADRRVRRRTRP